MKMMAGLFFSASSKAFRKFDSDSPAILDMISGPLIKKKKAPVSLATARAMSVITGTWRTVHEHTTGWLDTDRLEELWVTKRKLYHLTNLGHLLPATTDVIVSDIREAGLLRPHA